MAYLAEIVQWISAGVTAVVDGTPRTAASVNAGLTDLANRTRWLKDRLYDRLVGPPLTISAVDTGTDRLTVTSHAIPSNAAVQVFAANGGTLPGGLSAGTVYYVGVVDANTITLSASSGPGATVDLTAGYVGDCYVCIIPDWLSTLLIADATYGYGKLTSLVVFLAGAQTITGAKIVDDVTLSGVTNLKVASRSITRGLAVTWVNPATGLAYIGGPVTIATGVTAWAMFELPHGQTLTNVTISINPADTGALPTLPTFSGSAYDVATGLPVGAGFGPITDASADAAAYSATHEISSGALTEAIVGTSRRYEVSFANASGANIVINGLRATCTITSKTNWS